jgi:hypothetical protein
MYSVITGLGEDLGAGTRYDIKTTLKVIKMLVAKIST